MFLFSHLGHQLSVFNNQAAIQIGGKWNREKQRIERPFSGVISGLVFNGLRILDLAYEKDRRTEIRGDVSRVTTIRNRVQEPMQYQQMQPVTKYPIKRLLFIYFVYNLNFWFLDTHIGPIDSNGRFNIFGCWFRV